MEVLLGTFNHDLLNLFSGKCFSGNWYDGQCLFVKLYFELSSSLAVIYYVCATCKGIRTVSMRHWKSMGSSVIAVIPVALSAVTTFPLKPRGRRCLGQCFALVGLREKNFILPIDYNFIYMSAPSVCRSHAVALSYVRAFVYAN